MEYLQVKFDAKEYNDEFVDFVVDVAAHVTPITSVYGSGRLYKDELVEWNDMLACLVHV